MKRVLGLPGERIRIDGGIVSVNGEWVNEPYARKRNDWWLGETTLGGDEYFVVGDNRSMPMHLHDMGTVSRARLIGPQVF